MVTAKNSRKRRAAPSPAAATIAGTTVPLAARVSIAGSGADSAGTSSVDSEASLACQWSGAARNAGVVTSLDDLRAGRYLGKQIDAITGQCRADLPVGLGDRHG